MPTDIAKLLETIRAGGSVKFNERDPVRVLLGVVAHRCTLKKVCDHFFGAARVHGSHHVYKTPWAGDPRVNIQRDGNTAKPYQVKQVLAAIQRLQSEGARK